VRVSDPCYRGQFSFGSLHLSLEEYAGDNGEGGEDTGALQIILQDKESEHQRLPAPETSTPGTVVGSHERGDGPIGEFL